MKKLSSRWRKVINQIAIEYEGDIKNTIKTTIKLINPVMKESD